MSRCAYEARSCVQLVLSEAVQLVLISCLEVQASLHFPSSGGSLAGHDES